MIPLQKVPRDSLDKAEFDLMFSFPGELNEHWLKQTIHGSLRKTACCKRRRTQRSSRIAVNVETFNCNGTNFGSLEHLLEKLELGKQVTQTPGRPLSDWDAEKLRYGDYSVELSENNTTLQMKLSEAIR